MTDTVAPKMTGRSRTTLSAHALTRTRRSSSTRCLPPVGRRFSTRDLFWPVIIRRVYADDDTTHWRPVHSDARRQGIDIPALCDCISVQRTLGPGLASSWLTAPFCSASHAFDAQAVLRPRTRQLNISRPGRLLDMGASGVAKLPLTCYDGAEDGIRTRDPHLGKVVGFVPLGLTGPRTCLCVHLVSTPST